MFEILWHSLFLLMIFLILLKCSNLKKRTIGMFFFLFYLVSIKPTYLLLSMPIKVKSYNTYSQCESIVVLGGIDDYDRILKGLELSGINNSTIIFSGKDDKYKQLLNSFDFNNVIFEDKSINTMENVINSTNILRSKGINQICMVTSNEHLLRSKILFEKMNIEVIPISSSLRSSDLGLSSFLPRIKYYKLNASLVYEYSAIVYYILQKRIEIKDLL